MFLKERQSIFFWCCKWESKPGYQSSVSVLFPLVSYSTTSPDRLGECHQTVPQPVGRIWQWLTTWGNERDNIYLECWAIREDKDCNLCLCTATFLAMFSSHWRFLGFHHCDQGWNVHLLHSYSVPTKSCRWCCSLPQGWCHLCHRHHQGGKCCSRSDQVLAWGTLSVICSAWCHSKSAGRKWGAKRKYMAMNPSIFSLSSAFLTHLHFIALVKGAEEKNKQFESNAIFDNVNAQPFTLSRIQICNFKMEFCQSHFFIWLN